MTLEELKKKLKQAQNIKILFQELENNEFIATIKGIINSMEKKQKEPTNKEILLTILSRLDNIEKDVSELKIDVKQLKTEAINHGWDINIINTNHNACLS